MTHNIEIEKRFQVLNSDLSPILQHLDFLYKKKVIDEYLDTKDGSFFKRGIFIRIRNNKQLDIKFNPAHLNIKKVKKHTTCHEYKFKIPFQESCFKHFNGLQELININKPNPLTLENFIKQNHLCSLIKIDKIRRAYTNEKFIVALDEIFDIGTFIEFEAIDGNRNESIVLKEINNLVSNITLKEINTGSVEIALKKQNSKLYMQGKYLLDEDREKADVELLS